MSHWLGQIFSGVGWLAFFSLCFIIYIQIGWLLISNHPKSLQNKANMKTKPSKTTAYSTKPITHCVAPSNHYFCQCNALSFIFNRVSLFQLTPKLSHNRERMGLTTLAPMNKSTRRFFMYMYIIYFSIAFPFFGPKCWYCGSTTWWVVLLNTQHIASLIWKCPILINSM